MMGIEYISCALLKSFRPTESMQKAIELFAKNQRMIQFYFLKKIWHSNKLIISKFKK